MPIAYLIIILTAFIFGRVHWPFANILMILSVLIMCVDLMMQFIRLLLKKADISVLFGSIALSFVSVGYAFVWLSWPGAYFTALFGILLAAGYIVYWLVSRRKPTARFVVVLLATMVLGVLLSMKRSALYCLKNNFDPQNLVAPVFAKHYLAWLYNLEDNQDAAMQLLLDEKKYVEQRLALKETGRPDKNYLTVYTQDLKIIDEAIVDLSRKKWTYYTPLPPNDYSDE